MDRFWIAPEKWGEELKLSGDEAHHARRVMRKKRGEVIEVFDGEGRWARGEISEISDTISLVVEKSGRTPKPQQALEVAVGIPKGKTFEWIIQKSVELGVRRIFPLITENGMVKISEKDSAKKKDKWDRVVLEACKQCGQNWMPEVMEAQVFSDWFASRTTAHCEMVAALLDESIPLGEYLEKTTLKEQGRVRILVGPEGDFSKSEYSQMIDNEIVPIALGPLVLKVETAVFYFISNVASRF